MRRRKVKLTKMTFSKWAVMVIIIVAIIDLNICIFLNREEIEISHITEIIGDNMTYAIKVKKKKKNQEENRLREKGDIEE